MTNVAYRAHMRSRGAPSGVGVVRRLQALSVAGWTRDQLAWRLGVTKERLRRLYAGQSCPEPLCLRVVALYDHLREVSPEDTGDARGARGDALYRGWSPASAWPGLSIDDPAASPVSADMLALIEDVDWMASTGECWTGVCRRVQVSRKTLYTSLWRAGRLDLWERLTAVAA